jgi:hypothetical protein
MLHVAIKAEEKILKKRAIPPTNKADLKAKVTKMARKRKFKKRLHEEELALPRQTLPIDESEYSLCVLLWQSTIVQALYDLASTSRSAESRQTRAEAANWFFLSPADGDFRMVCELACLCPQRVLRVARKVTKEGEKALEGFNFRTIRRDLSDRQPTKRVKNINRSA